jgi:hypothetical protein
MNDEIYPAGMGTEMRWDKAVMSMTTRCAVAPSARMKALELLTLDHYIVNEPKRTSPHRVRRDTVGVLRRVRR